MAPICIRLAIPALLASVALFPACHGVGAGIVFQNTTSSTVTVYFDGLELFPSGEIPPGQISTVEGRKRYFPERIQVYNAKGEVLLDQVFTWEDLEERNFEIIIAEVPTAP